MREPCLVQWAESESPELANEPERLREVISLLHASFQGQPTTLEVRVADDTLYLGVGAPETAVLIHRPEIGSGWTEEFTSQGDSKRNDEIDFYLFGHHTPHSGTNVVAFGIALEAVLEFCRTGDLPGSLQWEKNRF